MKGPTCRVVELAHTSYKKSKTEKETSIELPEHTTPKGPCACADAAGAGVLCGHHLTLCAAEGASLMRRLGIIRCNFHEEHLSPLRRRCREAHLFVGNPFH